MDAELLRKACIASRPDVFDVNGDLRDGQPAVLLDLVRGQVERALVVALGNPTDGSTVPTGMYRGMQRERDEARRRVAELERAAAAGPTDARVVDLEDKLAGQEERAAGFLRQLSTQAAEHEQALGDQRRRSDAAIALAERERDTAMRERDRIKDQRDDLDAKMARLEHEARAQKAQPASGSGDGGEFEEFLRGVQELFGSRGGSSGGPDMNDLFRRLGKLFGDDEGGKGGGRA